MEVRQLFFRRAAIIPYRLNTWHSKGSPPAPSHSAGLFHTAILYPTRKELAIISRRLLAADYPLSGASDPGVSEAIYFNDPDNNDVELYWDKPKDLWKYNSDGSIIMVTEPLSITDLLKELE